MALERARSGETVDLRSFGEAPGSAGTMALASTDGLKVIRLVIPKGHELPTHRANGPITFQCLGGRVAFTSGGTTRELVAGHWLFLDAREPHSVVGLENSSVLLTVIP